MHVLLLVSDLELVCGGTRSSGCRQRGLHGSSDPLDCPVDVAPLSSQPPIIDSELLLLGFVHSPHTLFMDGNHSSENSMSTFIATLVMLN
jgi:hypothetical protein